MKHMQGVVLINAYLGDDCHGDIQSRPDGNFLYAEHVHGDCLSKVTLQTTIDIVDKFHRARKPLTMLTSSWILLKMAHGG